MHQMKINTVITILLIAIILASCTPAVKLFQQKRLFWILQKLQHQERQHQANTIQNCYYKTTNTPQPVHLDFEGIQSGNTCLFWI